MNGITLNIRTLAVAAALAITLGVATASPAIAAYRTDTTFGQGGRVSAALGPRDHFDSVSSQALVQDSKGRLVLGAANEDEWQIKRYLGNGQLDASFGDEGTVVVDQWGGIESDWEGTANLTQLAVRPDGRIIAVGFLGGLNRGYERPRIAMQQLLPDGSPDHSFGSMNGSRTYGSGTGAAAVALQRDGRFLVAGFAQRGSSGREISGTLFRFNSDGSLDSGFASGGRLSIRGTGNKGPLKTKSSYLLDVEVLPDGRIVTASTKKGAYAVVRLQRNGRYDRSFGRAGTAVVPVDPGRCGCELGRAIDIDPRGRVLLTGYVSPPEWKKNVYGATIRLDRHGDLDRAFGNGGLARLARGRLTQLYDVAVDPRGGIWVTGRTKSKTGVQRTITARYLKDGRLDRGFFDKGVLRGGYGESDAGWRVLAEGSRVYLAGRWENAESEFTFLRTYVWE